MRKWLALAFCILLVAYTPALAQDTPVETVTANGSALIGGVAWHFIWTFNGVTGTFGAPDVRADGGRVSAASRRTGTIWRSIVSCSGGSGGRVTVEGDQGSFCLGDDDGAHSARWRHLAIPYPEHGGNGFQNFWRRHRPENSRPSNAAKFSRRRNGRCVRQAGKAGPVAHRPRTNGIPPASRMTRPRSGKTGGCCRAASPLSARCRPSSIWGGKTR